MSDLNKKELSERDICTKFITPALTAGNKWELMSQIRDGASPSCWRNCWTTTNRCDEMGRWKASDAFKGAGWMKWRSTG
jgi:hypothetical protein